MRRIVVRMSSKAAEDLGVHLGAELVHGDRTGRVVALSNHPRYVAVELEIDGPAALTGIPGEPPDAAGSDA
jgi:hypothetical protein